MASIKSSRYVADGEVDPGIRAMAELLMSRSNNHDLQGETVDTSPLSEEDAWLFASKIGSLDRRILNIDVAGTVDAYGNGGVDPFSRYAIDQALLTIRAEWDNARRALTVMFSNPNVVQALLFYQGELGEELPRRLQEARGDLQSVDAENLAQSIASSIPPLGRAWIATRLQKDGVQPAQAKTIAEEVYASGSNLTFFEAGYTRRREIERILRAVDPNVSDAQIERVARSPMSLDEIRNSPLVRGGSGGDSSSSSGGFVAVLGAAAAVLLFFLFRGKR